MALEEKLKHLYDSAIGVIAAQNEVSTIELKDSLDKQLEEYKKIAKEEASQREQAESDGIKKKSNIELSKESIRIRYELADYKAKLTDSLFDEVGNRLSEYRKTDEYRTLLLKYISDAKNFAGSEVLTLYMDPDDVSLKEALERESGAELKVSSYSFGGGLRAIIPSQNILIENAFATKLGEQKKDFLEQL